MGINKADILTLARKIGIYNCNAIYYVKNSLMVITEKIQKDLENEYDKLKILILDKYKGVNVELILANPNNNSNHDLTKVDVDLIYDMLEEVALIKDESSN